MLDLEGIVGFDWDDGNARKNEKHGVSQAEAEQAFFDPRLLILFDERHSASEPRHHALGVTITGRYLHIVFTMRDRMTRIRVISARPMHRRERRFYASQDN